MSSFKTIDWIDSKVVMIDQSKLPNEEIYREYTSYKEVADAIRSMVIRGAPAIGIAASMGIAIGSLQADDSKKENFLYDLDEICERLASTRPTAFNLFWAINRMKKLFFRTKKKKFLKSAKNLSKRLKEYWTKI